VVLSGGPFVLTSVNVVKLAKFIQLVPNTKVVAANLVGQNDSRLVNATIVPYAIFTFASGDKAPSASTPPVAYLCFLRPWL
jgi:hypothetical protein